MTDCYIKPEYRSISRCSYTLCFFLLFRSQSFTGISRIFFEKRLIIRRRMEKCLDRARIFCLRHISAHHRTSISTLDCFSNHVSQRMEEKGRRFDKKSLLRTLTATFWANFVRNSVVSKKINRFGGKSWRFPLSAITQSRRTTFSSTRLKYEGNSERRSS